MINSLRNDLESRNEFFTSLALSTICNIGGKTMAEALTPVVQKIFLSAYATTEKKNNRSSHLQIITLIIVITKKFIFFTIQLIV
jgi:hypothetical protein